jgi:hypothetical protein
MAEVVVCAGRRVDRYARPVSAPCGTTWTANEGQTIDHARVTGWRIGPADTEGRREGLCPRCVHGVQDDTEEAPSRELEDQLALFPPQPEGHL